MKINSTFINYFNPYDSNDIHIPYNSSSNQILMILNSKYKFNRIDLGIKSMKYIVEEIPDSKMIIVSNLNNISDQTMVLPRDTSLLIHIFKGNETSYATPFGVSNVYFDNKIWADKLVIATGFSGASQKVLALNCSRFNHGLNSATMYCFDGASSYTSSCIARNVRDVDLLDGYPVAYTRNMNDLSLLAEEVGLPLTEDLYERWSTCYLDDYSIDTDVNGNEYVYYNSYFKRYIKK